MPQTSPMNWMALSMMVLFLVNTMLTNSKMLTPKKIQPYFKVSKKSIKWTW